MFVKTQKMKINKFLAKAKLVENIFFFINNRSEVLVMKNIGSKLFKKNSNKILGGNMLLSKNPNMILPDYWPSYYKKI